MAPKDGQAKRLNGQWLHKWPGYSSIDCYIHQQTDVGSIYMQIELALLMAGRDGEGRYSGRKR